MCEEETLGMPEKRNRRSKAQEMYIEHGKLDELPHTQQAGEVRGDDNRKLTLKANANVQSFFLA